MYEVVYYQGHKLTDEECSYCCFLMIVLDFYINYMDWSCLTISALKI